MNFARGRLSVVGCRWPGGNETPATDNGRLTTDHEQLTTSMFSNYLKIAVRNLSRHRGLSFINIIGLAIGMACCILILMYVLDELSFDRHHENAARIYRVVLERHALEKISLDTSTPAALAPALLDDLPGIAQAVRFLSPDNPIPLLGYSDKRFYERRFAFVDPDVFEVFTMPFVRGDAKTALQKQNAVVITEAMARKYFGNEDPLGKSLAFNNDLDLEVTGVVQSVPQNSTLQLDFLASFSTIYGWLGRGFVDSWQNHMCQTYLLLSKTASAKVLQPQLPDLLHKYLGEASLVKQAHLQPLNRIHLYSFQDYGLLSGGDIRTVYMLAVVGFFVLLIACINSMSLTTARSAQRSKEVGIRKAVGATRRQLIKQFFAEALISAGLAMLVAVLMVEFGLPRFSALIGRELAVDYFQDWRWWLELMGIGLCAGLLSGSYPALLLSAFRPLPALKGHLKSGSTAERFRKTLVLVQFTLTIALIIGTEVVYDQLNFMRNKPLGFDKDQVIVVPIRDQNLRQHPEPLKDRLRQLPGILQVAAAALLPGGPVGQTRFRAEGTSHEGTMSMLWVDHDFISALGMKLIAGRDFSGKFETDATQAVILNQEAVIQLGWAAPAEAIGKSFELVGSKKGTIIGVVGDFHFSSLHRKIEPLVLHIWPWQNYLLVRVNVAYLPRLIGDLQNRWQEFDAAHPLTFTFLDDNFDRFYQSEQRLGQVAGYFSLLAIVVASLGLFGLASFAAEQRTKEIGIRKVLGASKASLVNLLSKEFVKPVILANVIAWPVGYNAMQSWLQNFAYRVHLDWWMFVLAGGLALIIALLTTSTQALRAALANPVESLRYE